MNKPGYIIMLTLLIISSAVALITVVVRESFRYQAQTRLARETSYVRLLVFSSLECVLSKLSLVLPKEEKTGKANESKEEESELPTWAAKVIPVLNKWQKIESPEIEGTISYYLASEGGKFNLTDFDAELGGEKIEKQEGEEKEKAAAAETNKEHPSPFAAFQELLKKETNIRLKEALVQFKRQYERMPEDVTELLKIPLFTPPKDRLFVTKEEGEKVDFSYRSVDCAP